MNPLTIEQQYQLLQQTLPLMASRRMKLLRIVDFLEPLLERPHRAAVQAYAPELLEIFLRELSLVDLAGTPLSFCRRLQKTFEALQVHLPSAAHEEEWKSAAGAVLREQSAMEGVLRRKATGAALDAVYTNRGGMRPAPGPQVPLAVTIPVVERELLLQKSEPVFASIRTVGVEIHFSRKLQGEDEIFVDQMFDPDGTQHRQVRQAVQIGRLLLRQFAAIKDSRRLMIHCVFDEPNVVAGESLGAALAFAVFAELVHLYRHREAVSLRPDVALTGVTDLEGNIRVVDEGGLRLKVQACAYSRVRFLVVPREQEPVARQALEQMMAEDGSNPSLAIIGVSALHEILYDRRLTVVRRKALPVYLVERVWGHRRSLVVAVMLAMVAIVLRLWYGPIDRTPARIEFDHSELRIQNVYGDVLDRIEVGLSMAALSKRTLESQRNSRLAILADVNRDGVMEVVAVRETEEGNGSGNELCCWQLMSEKPMWTYSVHQRVEIPNIVGPAEDRFTIQGIIVDDINDDGNQEIVVIACHPKRYPCTLTILRAASGAETARYLHIGWINDVLAARLAGDSVKSIVACGINNAFKQACLLVLDPRVVRGVSPTASEWMPKEFSPGTERYYMLFPRTIVGETFRAQNYGNLGLQVAANREGRISVSLEDFKAFVPEFGQTVSGVLTCILGKGLILETADRDEALSLTAEVLERKGRIPMLPDDVRFSEYRKGLRYWDGERWQDRPVINQWYRLAYPLSPSN